jgi:hypothetical protein
MRRASEKYASGHHRGIFKFGSINNYLHDVSTCDILYDRWLGIEYFSFTDRLGLVRFIPTRPGLGRKPRGSAGFRSAGVQSLSTLTPRSVKPVRDHIPS